MATILTAGLFAWPFPWTGCSRASERPTISFDPSFVIGNVSPLLFGVNHRRASRAQDSVDPATGYAYPTFVSQIADIGFTMIRYPGGMLANTFQWQRAIGPQGQRTRQIGGYMRQPLSQDSTFGPDEYGDLLEKTGARADIVVNFATASASDAAGLVAYLNAPIGGSRIGGIDWAAKRAANGRAAPYNKIAYVEVGNEYDPYIQPIIDENYWIKGDVVAIDASCADHKIACLYALGGSTRFDNQPVVQRDDWTEGKSLSTGAPNQIVYARYPPVTAGTAIVLVDGKPWNPVGTLSAEGMDANVYAIDERTGAISFGDGAHGAIPPRNARIAVSYVSGPHEGFVDFYRAIKAVDPSIRVCAAIADENFVRIMGAQRPYDCLVMHPYVIIDPNLSVGLDRYFVRAIYAPNHGSLETVQQVRDHITRYAGPRAAEIGILASEYGHLGGMPPEAPHFRRALAGGVQHAAFIREWILSGVEAADRHTLTDYVYAEAPPDLREHSDGDNALLSGPGPETVVTPVALSMKLLRENTGDQVIASRVTGVEELQVIDGKTVPALLAYATKDEKGVAYVVVINVDPERDTTAKIAPANFAHGDVAKITTLDSPNLSDENDLERPMLVALQERSVRVGREEFVLTFPRHSVTAIKLAPE